MSETNQNSTKRSQVSLGHIPYLNLVPFYKELLRGVDRERFLLRSAHPSEINRLLASGEIQAAPASSVCLLKYPEMEMIAPIGVAATGPVMSVYLGFERQALPYYEIMKERLQMAAEILRASLRQHQDDLKSAAQISWNVLDDWEASGTKIPLLRLSPNSSTSVALSKLIFRICFGQHACMTRISQIHETHHFENELPEIQLLIGDEALEQRSRFAQVLDLGQCWYDLTGMSFTYAVWQGRSENLVANKSIEDALTNASERSQNRMHVEPSYYLQSLPQEKPQGLEDLIPEYWAAIRYRLTSQDIKSLLFFLAMVKPLFKIEHTELWSTKFLRWQDRFRSESFQGM